MTERAVITGVGVCSALGEAFEDFLDNVLQPRCAAKRISCFEASTFGAPFAGEMSLPEAWVQEAAEATGLDPLALQIDRKLIFALRAIRGLTGLTRSSEGPPSPNQSLWRGSAGLSLGMGLEVLFLPDVVSLYDTQTKSFNLTRLPLANRKNPLRLPLHTIADAIAREAGITGSRQVFVSACAAGAQCLGEAARRVMYGPETRVLAGATDSMINPMGVGCFRLLGALSGREAHDACRPFHAHRDGTIIGEGAAFFMVESLSSARARGAKIFAEILGFGSSLDAYRVTSPAPDGAGARSAMRAALTQAKRPSLGYVNAHGTGTIQNDPVEIAAIHSEVGESVLLSSTKSQLGHAMAAAGALEIAASLACFVNGLCPPTLHLSQVDPACQANHVLSPTRFVGDALLKNSFGFGGQNASIVLGAPP